MTSEKHRLRLMGAFAASAPLSRKARALLAYLALNADAPVTRERLAGLLWSERGEEQARASLRQCLGELRPFAAGLTPLIEIGRESLVLHGERAATELDEFRAMARSGDAPGMAAWLDRVAARLLENLDGLDPAFDEWLAVRRAALGNQILAEAMACAQAARPADALRLSQAIMAREPLDEAAARLAMTAAHALGEAGEVSRVWRRLTAALREEAGVDPSAETAACHARCARAAPRPASLGVSPIAPAAPHTPRRRFRLWLASAAALLGAGAVIVLWQVGSHAAGPGNMLVDRLQAPAGDAAAALFADGFAADLARMAEARPTQLRIFETGAANPVGGAMFTVAGQARSVAGSINATLEVRAAGDQAILWSADFHRPLAEAADMRRQAAIKLADVLACAGAGNRAIDLDTLKLYLVVCEKFHDDGALEGARQLLLKIVARAPRFPRAWSDLALVDGGIATDHDTPPEQAAQMRREADAAADHALALDARNGDAWVARAQLAQGLANWERREAALARALAVEPGNDQAQDLNADAMEAVGRMRDAVAAVGRSAALNPLSPRAAMRLAITQASAGGFGRAMGMLDEARRLWPDSTVIRDYRLYLIARQGDPAAARRLLDDPGARPPINGAELEYWRRLIATRGDPHAADAAAAFFLAHAGKDLGLPMAIQGLAAINRADAALDLLENNIPRSGEFTIVFWRPSMAGFRASPRFMPLAARLGLVRIWRKTGKWPDFCTARDAPYDCKARAAAAGA